MEKDLNATKLLDGSLNPLHEAIAVGETEKKNPPAEETLTITVVLKKVSSIFSQKKAPGIEVLTFKRQPIGTGKRGFRFRQTGYNRFATGLQRA